MGNVFAESSDVSCLSDVTVCAELIAAVDVALVGRGREDDDRDASERAITLDQPKHFASVGAREVEVEQD